MKSKNVFKYFALLALLSSVVACSPTDTYITILHTNDTHSQVEPIEAGKRDGNHAGYARRMGIIEQERAKTPNVLLVDAGDFSQGTPYFNFYHGRIEVDAMNRMGYDAVTLGNHEFDYGVDTLAAVLKNAQFAVVCANYDVTNSPLENIVKPYTILRRENLRIGVFGISIDPQGLIAEKNFQPLQYLNPVESAQQTATLLKEEKRCDLVICLSHQGTHHGDVELAKATRNIDVIIGGHTHKIVENMYVENLDGDSVLLSQMGKSGARIGKIRVELSE